VIWWVFRNRGGAIIVTGFVDTYDLTDEEYVARLRRRQDELYRNEQLRLLTIALTAGVVLFQDPTCPQHPAFQYTPPDGSWPFVHLHRMIFNWRLSEYDGFLSYGRFWCFEGRGDVTFRRALHQLVAWQGNPRAQPQGWIKAWDGRPPTVRRLPVSETGVPAFGALSP
jgi:hypothetical protein